MLASNLLRSRKTLGLDKSVTQSFLKRFVTPHGQYRNAQRPKLLPINPIPAHSMHSSINLGQLPLHAHENAAASLMNDSGYIVTDKPLEMLG